MATGTKAPAKQGSLVLPKRSKKVNRKPARMRITSSLWGNANQEGTESWRKASSDNGIPVSASYAEVEPLEENRFAFTPTDQESDSTVKVESIRSKTYVRFDLYGLFTKFNVQVPKGVKLYAPISKQEGEKFITVDFGPALTAAAIDRR